MKYWVLIDGDRPDPADPWSIFRGPDRGGPPWELYDPTTGQWDEEVSLIDYFTGDDAGAQEVPEAAVPDIIDQLREDALP